MQIDDLIINAELIDVLTELKTQLANVGIQRFAKMFDSGEDVMVCCPYHKDGQERRPSAGIRKSDGVFHCLACGESHILPEVVAHCFGYKDVTLGYRWLAQNFVSAEVHSRASIKIDLVRNNTSNKSSVLDNSGAYKLLCVSEEELDSYRYTHPYLYKRGLNDAVIDMFDLGYDKNTDSITFPVRYWGSMNFGQCMFVAKRRIKQKRFDLPSNIDKPLYGLYELWNTFPKYKNWYHTENREHMSYMPEIYVCEGLFDCLRLWSNYKYAIAGFGCLFSDYQIQLLQGLPARKLILAFDNDEAGKDGADRIKRAIKNKIITEVILPEGKKDIGECTDEEIQNLQEVF